MLGNGPRVIVYIAGPISKGLMFKNLEQAFVAANELLLAGFSPYVPHLTVFWNWIYPPRKQKSPYFGDHDLWLPYDRAFLDASDCLLRLDGYSLGADLEVEYMIKEGKPVFSKVQDLIDYYEPYREKESKDVGKHGVDEQEDERGLRRVQEAS